MEHVNVLSFSRCLPVCLTHVYFYAYCGITRSYLLYMIERSGVESELGQAASLIALGCVKMGFVFVGAKLLDSEGRRPLFLKSLFGTNIKKFERCHHPKCYTAVSF